MSESATNAIELAQLTDLHTTTPSFGPGEWSVKRGLAWLAWRRRRRGEHRAEVAERALDDLRESPPDHLVITGDLTNLGTRAEIESATRWLEGVGCPADVTLIPGNHDAYVWPPAGEREGWERWAPWMTSDSSDVLASELSAPLRDSFPMVRRRGDLAIVGLCSVFPTSLFKAHGGLGERQLEALADVLAGLEHEGLCRVVLLHHPPVARGQSARRRLHDAARLGEVLARVGAELVLHGHTHETRVSSVRGPAREIPVVGARSSSALGGRHEDRRATYHRYRIERVATGPARWRITLVERAYDAATHSFVAAGERVISPA